jgi:miniconductance mechanosensitive channel
MIEVIQKYVMSLFGLSYEVSFFLGFAFLSLTVLLLCFFADFIAKTYLVRVVNLVIAKAHFKLAQFLKDRSVVTKLSRVAPGLVLYLSAAGFYSSDMEATKALVTFLHVLATGYILFTMTNACLGLLDVVEDLYNQYEVSKKRPIKSYLQIVKIIFFSLASILFVSLLLGQSPLAFFTGIGAATTILLLIFKDAIVGFLASVQLASYDMIRIGDWIEVEKYGANGNVIEIALTTVKVRNFDKTIITIPNYALVNEGVKNWRGMQDSGGRRMKRSVRLDISSFTFCDDSILRQLQSHSFFKDFLSERSAYFKTSWNETSNATLFRHYLDFYLKRREDVYTSAGDFTFLIRELDPDEYGLPLELYVFTKTTNWGEYESIQADIMDHVFSALPFFNLKVFQRK